MSYEEGLRMEYGKILERAWKITWRHKVLWIFGVAAVLFGAGNQGSGGGGGNGIQYVFGSQDIARWQRRLPWGRLSPFLNWRAGLPLILGILGLIFVMGLLFAIAGIIVRYTSFGALIGLVDTVEGEDEEKVTFQRGLRTGWRRFLPLFAIDILISIGTFIVVMIIIVLFILGVLVAVLPAIPLFRAGNALNVAGILWGVGIGLFLLLFLLLASLAISAFVTVLRMFAFRASVMEKENVFEALGKAFTLIQAHLWPSLVMWVLLVLINLAVGVVMIPVMLLGIGGMVGPALAVFRVTRSFAGAALAALPALLVMALIGLFVGSIYLVYRSTVWTLTFRALRGEAPAEG
ncbi:MAG: hypothetical protein U9R48_04000 [Chloroflexota bacterium]|nr:hypothetical protein [Chloroflexota bacterium]